MLGSGRSTMRPEPHRSGSKWGQDSGLRPFPFRRARCQHLRASSFHRTCDHAQALNKGRTRSPLATPEKHLCKPVCKSLFPSIPPPAGFPCDLLASQIRELTMTKTKAHPKMGTCFGSGGRTRTCDLVVMSHTSCHCSTPRYCFGSNCKRTCGGCHYPAILVFC